MLLVWSLIFLQETFQVTFRISVGNIRCGVVFVAEELCLHKFENSSWEYSFIHKKIFFW